MLHAKHRHLVNESVALLLTEMQRRDSFLRVLPRDVVETCVAPLLDPELAACTPLGEPTLMERLIAVLGTSFETSDPVCFPTKLFSERQLREMLMLVKRCALVGTRRCGTPCRLTRLFPSSPLPPCLPWLPVECCNRNQIVPLCAEWRFLPTAEKLSS